MKIQPLSTATLCVPGKALATYRRLFGFSHASYQHLNDRVKRASDPNDETLIQLSSLSGQYASWASLPKKGFLVKEDASCVFLLKWQDEKWFLVKVILRSALAKWSASR